MLSASTRDKIEAVARGTALLFFDEHHEPFDPEQTDWHGEAWDVDSREMEIPYDNREAFDLYVKTLVRETTFLAIGNRT
jgi:hypothetical protein